MGSDEMARILTEIITEGLTRKGYKSVRVEICGSEMIIGYEDENGEHHEYFG